MASAYTKFTNNPCRNFIFRLNLLQSTPVKACCLNFLTNVRSYRSSLQCSSLNYSWCRGMVPFCCPFTAFYSNCLAERISVGIPTNWGFESIVANNYRYPYYFFSYASRYRRAVFLVLAALLGIICSLAYIQSGSLWTPVMIHWLLVVVWLLLLVGYRKLYSW